MTKIEFSLTIISNYAIINLSSKFTKSQALVSVLLHIKDAIMHSEQMKVGVNNEVDKQR